VLLREREDAPRAAGVVRASLEQVLDAAAGQDSSTIIDAEELILAAPDTFNVCKLNYMPHRSADRKYGKLLAEILAETPAPGLAEGLGELPRFRAEIGPFIGIMSAM